MKICIMSDTHFSAQKYGKIDHDKGMNRFMVRQFLTLDWIVGYLKSKEIKTIIHGGDVFDSSRVTAYPIKRVKEAFKDFDVYAIKGNHDDSNFFHDNEMSALDLLGINAFNKPETVIIDGVNFVFNPWGYLVDPKMAVEGKKNVLVAHGFPRDYLGLGKTLANDENKDVLSIARTSKFDLVITGHQHKVDEFTHEGTRYLNPGSISQFASESWDEVGSSIWILDTDDLSYERVKIPCAISVKAVSPQDPNDFLSKIDSEDIYRVYVNSKLSVDRRILKKASKEALDIEIKAVSERQSKEEVEKVDGFWEHVQEKKPSWVKEFKSILYEECNE